MKYCLVSFGCQMNLSDSERVRTVLERAGFSETGNEEEADLLGLVACSVRQRAIDRAIGRIKQWNEIKKKRPVITFATGCVLPKDREQFIELFDLFFHINEVSNLADMIRQHGVVTQAYHAGEPAEYAGGEPESVSGLAVRGPGATAANRPEPVGRATHGRGTHGRDEDRLQTDFWNLEPLHRSSFEAFVPIQNGCDKFCSFCAVPYTRGREISRPSGQILEEVRRLVDDGYKTITLLGQNVNSYGYDKRSDEIRFPELLGKIGELGLESGREFRVYFTSPHPRDMDREVFNVIASYPSLAKQIHLPLQSGDDKVLIAMNRNHTVEQYRDIVRSFRETLPTATLFTDIIVGFTGETEEQFENTRKAMRELRYNMAYIAMYSPRPGARSYRWEDNVPHDEKKRRLHELSAELKEMSLSCNRSLVGTTVRVLVSSRDRDRRYLSGRTEGKIIVRFPHETDELIGSFVDVTISSAAEMSVEGELERVPAAV